MLATVACLIVGLFTVRLIGRYYRIKHLVLLDGQPPSSYLTGHFNGQAERILGKRKDLLERGVDLESVTKRREDILTQLSMWSRRR
jgi:hypothetical protein